MRFHVTTSALTHRRHAVSSRHSYWKLCWSSANVLHGRATSAVIKMSSVGGLSPSPFISFHFSIHSLLMRLSPMLAWKSMLHFPISKYFDNICTRIQCGILISFAYFTATLLFACNAFFCISMDSGYICIFLRLFFYIYYISNKQKQSIRTQAYKVFSMNKKWSRRKRWQREKN